MYSEIDGIPSARKKGSFFVGSKPLPRYLELNTTIKTIITSMILPISYITLNRQDQRAHSIYSISNMSYCKKCANNSKYKVVVT